MIALGYVVNLFQRGTASVTRIHEILTAEAQPLTTAAARPELARRSAFAAKSNSAISPSPTATAP